MAMMLVDRYILYRKIRPCIYTSPDSIRKYMHDNPRDHFDKILDEVLRNERGLEMGH
jgi:hypothetical protein